MAPRLGVEDQAAVRAANQRNAAQGLTVGRPQYQIVADRTVPNRPSLTDEERQTQLALSRVTPDQWAALGRMGGGGGGGGQQTSPAPDAPAETAPPSVAPPSGGPGQGSMSNIEATQKYFADALKFLSDLATRGGQTINESVGRMKADPYNLANAYANLQLAAPTVAANPIAEYAAAAGLSDAQAAAAQQLAAAESAATGRALQNITDVMNTAQQQANLSRLADIGLIETGAQQDLQDRLATMALALKQGELGAITGLQQQNLQNQLNMRNAIANQISNVFAGQNVAPESILKLIQETLNRMNMSQWTNIPTGPVVGRPVEPDMRIQPIGIPGFGG